MHTAEISPNMRRKWGEYAVVQAGSRNTSTVTQGVDLNGPYTGNAASVNQMRLFSSVALEKAPKLKLAANCSAAEGMISPTSFSRNGIFRAANYIKRRSVWTAFR